MHRIFTEGRNVFVSTIRLIISPLDQTAKRSLLLGGGIGITPMIAMAHQLHAAGDDFAIHYSSSKQASAALLILLDSVPWKNKLQLHFSDRGTRADLDSILARYEEGDHLYICGADRYMSSVIEACKRNHWPEESIHQEFFSVPETPDYVNHAFSVRLAKSGKTITIPADRSIAECLIEKGLPIDLKCSNGLCGVCKCGLVSGDVDHRDYVLSKAQQENTIITCQSRATDKDGELVLDL